MARSSTRLSGPDIDVVVPAAGVGRRMGGRVPKQYLRIAGRPVIAWTLEAVLAHPRVAGATVALAEQDDDWTLGDALNGKPLWRVPGGDQRQASVLSALRWLSQRRPGSTLVLVHDAVRPCLDAADLDALIAAAEVSEHGALLAVPVRDTLKRSGEGAVVAATEDRSGLWQALTPQCFRLDRLLEALSLAERDRVTVTDEANAMERLGYHPRLVEGGTGNVKLTRPGDLPLISALLRSRAGGSGGVAPE